MKDKRVSEKSMKQFMNTLTPVESVATVKQDTPNDTITFDAKYNSTLQEYNKNILNFNTLYATLKPRSKVLVRVYAKEMVMNKGILVPTQQQILIKTQSGVGYGGTMDNPYPYSRKAVVIAVPEYINDLKQGDIVELSNNPVAAVAINGGDNPMINIPDSYTHFSYPYSELPTNPENEHFGYLLVNSQDIIMKL